MGDWLILWFRKPRVYRPASATIDGDRRAGTVPIRTKTMNTIIQDACGQQAQCSPFGNTDFVSVKEAAVRTNTGEETIRKAIRAGRIPAYGTRGRIRVRIADVVPVYVSRRKAAH
jgi:excisionase family DNA binding protein